MDKFPFIVAYERLLQKKITQKREKYRLTHRTDRDKLEIRVLTLKTGILQRLNLFLTFNIKMCVKSLNFGLN